MKQNNKKKLRGIIDLETRLSVYKSEFMIKYYPDMYFMYKFKDLDSQLKHAADYYYNKGKTFSFQFGPMSNQSNQSIQLHVKAKLNLLECLLNNPKITFMQIQDQAIEF